jgi:hypothetical protein
MIEVIKVINTQFPNRTENIYSSIFGRTSGYYADEPNIIFTEKNTIEHPDWIEENNISSFPTTLFYKDRELISTKVGIIASQHIIAEIEPYIPKFAIKK